jgi:hypothetical protein
VEPTCSDGQEKVMTDKTPSEHGLDLTLIPFKSIFNGTRGEWKNPASMTEEEMSRRHTLVETFMSRVNKEQNGWRKMFKKVDLTEAIETVKTDKSLNKEGMFDEITVSVAAPIVLSSWSVIKQDIKQDWARLTGKRRT